MRFIHNVVLMILLVAFVEGDHKKHLRNKPRHPEYPWRFHRGKHGKFRDAGTQSPILDTVSGKLTGKSAQTFSGTSYYQFLSVPFARPPVKDLRFEPPVPVKWDGVYNATYERDVCVQQQTDFTITGSEDCLYMNIYTPSSLESSAPLLPVMVFIFGGAFIGGDGHYKSYPPDGFINSGVVVVAINYRVGIFGFLSSGDEVVPGNMGLKDQLMALQWIQYSINKFGGDPSRVTIMGQSAGAASVTYLLQSPKTKGLFQRAIIHSGTSLGPWSLTRVARQNFELLGYKYFNNIKNIYQPTKQIVEKLKGESTETLLAISGGTWSWFVARDASNGFNYGPVIEPPNRYQFFSAQSYEQLSSCNFTSVPIIIGYNSAEAESNNFAFLNSSLDQIYMGLYDVFPEGLIPVDMNITPSSYNRLERKVGLEIKKLYVGNGEFAGRPKAVAKYITDDFFLRPAVEYERLYSNCNQPVFAYRFSYTKHQAGRGVSHGEELQYFFYNKEFAADNDRFISSNVMKLWTSFIKTGKPTSDGINATWEPTKKDNNYFYIDVGDQFYVQNQEVNPDKKYLEQWRYWYSTYGQRPFNTF